MKKFFTILVLLVFLAGCASSPMTKTRLMDKARAFDETQRGLERTPEYRKCYGEYFNYMFSECATPALEKHMPGTVPEDDTYWQCADDALELFKDCLGGK